MSSSAAATAGGGAPSDAADDSGYRAVAAGASVDEVRRAIERSRSPETAVNQAAGAYGETPLRAARRLFGRGDLICLLLESGAEGAGDGDWFAAVCWCVRENDLAGLRRLIELGVSVDTAGGSGCTPLLYACDLTSQDVDRRDLTLEVFRRSSVETRRAVCVNSFRCSFSALDCLIANRDGRPPEPWRAQMIGEMLAAGAPVLPDNAARAVPIAAAHAARREAELAALPHLGHDWRAQEAFVRLSLDVGELREAQQMVEERRARLALLELALGSETESGSGSESGSESESDESEEGEATGSGGGGGGGGH